MLDNHTTPARVREMNWNSDSDIYRDCLGIDSAGRQPDHYELLGLRPYRVGPAQVTESSNRRLQQLQSLRSNHGLYTRLAAEIDAARDCLADPSRKRAYDRQIQRERFVSPSNAPETRASVAEALQRMYLAHSNVKQSCKSTAEADLPSDALGTDALDRSPPRRISNSNFAHLTRSIVNGTASGFAPVSVSSQPGRLLPAALAGVLSATLTGVLVILAYSMGTSTVPTDHKPKGVSPAFDNGRAAFQLEHERRQVRFDASDPMPAPTEVDSRFDANLLGADVNVCRSERAELIDASMEKAEQKSSPPLATTMTSALAAATSAAPAIANQAHLEETPLTTPFIPGTHGVSVQNPVHYPDQTQIITEADNGSPAFEYAPHIQDQRQAIPSTPNAQPTHPRRSRLDQAAMLAELPPKVDVVGEGLSKQQKTKVVHTLTRLLNTQWEDSNPQILRQTYFQLDEMTQDPRVPFSIGLMMENQKNYPLALRWYKLARESQTVIPHFEAWRRSINIRMRRKEMDVAMDECIDLIDVLARLSQAKADQIDELERVLAYNVRFVGFVMGYVKRLSEYDARVFVANVQSEEHRVLARLHQFPAGEDYLAVFQAGKYDVRQTADELRALENETNAQNRIEAERNNQKINQGEVEYRKMYGPHVTGSDGVDYFEDRGGQNSLSDYHWFWPPFGRTRITKDTKAISEWRRVIKPKSRRAPRASQYIQTYFTSNLELVKRNLLDTFPDEHAVIQRDFVIK